jgi:hypothetical protein
MPYQPLAVTLTDGQKVEALKRLRDQYQETLTAIEADLTGILTGLAEADFLAGYLNEQPEVVALRARKGEVEALERKRLHLTKLIERLQQVIPPQPDATFSLGGASKGKPAAGALRRF